MSEYEGKYGGSGKAEPAGEVLCQFVHKSGIVCLKPIASPIHAVGGHHFFVAIAGPEAVEEQRGGDAERAAFEKWVGRALPNHALVLRQDGFYKDSTIAMLWQAWQARAALIRQEYGSGCPFGKGCPFYKPGDAPAPAPFNKPVPFPAATPEQWRSLAPAQNSPDHVIGVNKVISKDGKASHTDMIGDKPRWIIEAELREKLGATLGGERFNQPHPPAPAQPAQHVTDEELNDVSRATGWKPVSPAPAGEPDKLESQEFYDVMQYYRHMPLQRQQETIAAFETVKSWIRRYASRGMEGARHISFMQEDWFSRGYKAAEKSAERQLKEAEEKLTQSQHAFEALLNDTLRTVKSWRLLDSDPRAAITAKEGGA